MRIEAKYNGKCATCGKPTLKGSEIEYREKKAYHPACVEEALTDDGEQLELARRLGFELYDWDRLLRLLPSANPCGSTGRPEPEACRDGSTLWDVRAGFESEED